MVKEIKDSCQALRVLDNLELPPGLTLEDRRELVLMAYSEPELKARFDSYDKSEGEEDNSGIVRDTTCGVCSERYIGRGRLYHLGICNPCLEVHVAIRDADILKAEQELEITLKVYGFFRSR